MMRQGEQSMLQNDKDALDMTTRQQHSIQATIRKNVSLQYLLYLPPDYQRSENNWPLVISLHGAGERGTDLERVENNGIPKMIAQGTEFPFIVLAPQCSEQSVWPIEPDALHALVEKIIRDYRVDPSRIYLTGLSMGGCGAWHLAAEYPSMFAALVPICGRMVRMVGFPERIHVLKTLPIWVFHGALDDREPVQSSQELVDVLRNHQGNVQFTVYPDVKHDSWTQTYENPELYEWLLQQKNENFHISDTLLQET
jgi:predicted peptidase